MPVLTMSLAASGPALLVIVYVRTCVICDGCPVVVYLHAWLVRFFGGCGMGMCVGVIRYLSRGVAYIRGGCFGLVQIPYRSLWLSCTSWCRVCGEGCGMFVSLGIDLSGLRRFLCCVLRLDVRAVVIFFMCSQCDFLV